MDNVQKLIKIKREMLSGENYFQSLIEQGYNTHLLSDIDVETIQIDCLNLLAKMTERFNSGDTSSIRIEKAQDILASIIFTIGVNLKTYKNPDEAVQAIKKLGVEEICTAGRKRIDRLIAQAKMRHVGIVRRLLQTGNTFYSATVIDGIKGFFKLYSPDFAAQEIHITADYPVYNSCENLLGIEFIGHYLEQIYYENIFCTNFSAKDIHHLLCGYDDNYEDLLFNIYEVVLASALGCVISGAVASAGRLEITKDMQSFLFRKFEGKECNEIENILLLALLELCDELTLSESLMGYAKNSLPQLAQTISTDIKSNSIDKIFIIPKYIDDSPKLTVSYGEKMNDDLYSKVLDEFISCQSIVGKVDIIKEKIHSLADLNDLLLDSILTVEEVSIILSNISIAEIVALTKKYTAEYEMNFTELRNCEKILYEGIKKITSSLPLEQQTLLNSAVEILEDNY